MRRQNGILFIILLFVFVCVVVLIILLSPRQQAKDVITDFYRYEQAGEFAKSWELFHSQMKEKFTKGHYIQDRAHVFMNHFGVSTFSFETSRVKRIKKWQMGNETDSLDVYRVIVTQTYKGKYGNFEINQHVFAAKEQGDWKVLWDYNN